MVFNIQPRNRLLLKMIIKWSFLMEQKQYTTEEKLKIIAEALNKKIGRTIDFNKYQERYYMGKLQTHDDTKFTRIQRNN